MTSQSSRAPLSRAAASRWPLLLLLAAGACGAPAGPTASGPLDTADGPLPGDISAGQAGDATGDGAKKPMGDTTGGWDGSGQNDGGTAGAGPLWVLYWRLAQAPAGTDADLVLTGSVNPGALTDAAKYGCGISPIEASKPCVKLNKAAFSSAQNLSCAHGCVVSPDLKAVAIATGPHDSEGLFTYQLGAIAPDAQGAAGFQFIVEPLGQLTKVRDLHFAGPHLFYSTPVHQFITGSSRYEIRRRNMADLNGPDELLTLMAPPDDPDADAAKPHTTYAGRFRASKDGQTLLFLTPTLRSLKVWSWHDGALTQHDYICENKLNDADKTCVGVGSLYTDDHPAAVSPDGKVIVLFAADSQGLRLHRYPVDASADSTFTHLITLPPGANKLSDVCAKLPPWLHASVRGTPQFSPDGATLYFLGVSRCGGSQDKEWTDIMSVKVADIGKAVGPSLFVNYTHNPHDNSPANRFLRSFTLSPDGKSFVFNASPTWDPAGKPIAASDMVQMTGTELYVMAAKDGAEMVQITNEVAYDVIAPRFVSALAP